MKNKLSINTLLLSAMVSLSFPLLAQQVTPAKSVSEVIKPADNVRMPKEYIKTLAASAYVWGWPLVNQLNRRNTITRAPEPALLNGTLPAAPMSQLAMLHDYIKPEQRFVACPNQDVVYGLGYMSLEKEPVVIQVPDFGDRFWVYAMYDGRTDQFSKMGKPYGTKPGFYLVTSPGWNGKVPKGITGVLKSTMDYGMVVPRVFQDDSTEDRKVIQPVINQVVMYPLNQFDGKMKTIEWTKLGSIQGPKTTGGETRWVVPEKFFDQLEEVLAIVPPLPGEEAMYESYKSLLSAAKKDPAIKDVLVKTAQETEKNVIGKFLRWEFNGTPAGNNWNRSTNNAAWGVDYFNRTSTARSNIYENKLDETRYYYTDFDSKQVQLTGNNNYEITFEKGQEPPVNGFWSMTLYDKDHFFSPNKLNRYSLGTKNKNLKRNHDGSLTFYVGAKSPGKNLETNWLPAPKGNFSLYIRAYWGKDPILDGSWQPPVVLKVKNYSNVSLSDSPAANSKVTQQSRKTRSK